MHASSLLIFVFTAVLLHCDLSSEEPWGIDADLANCKTHSIPITAPATCPQSSPMVIASELLIKFHQEIVSPADGPRSHFIPSSSNYTLEAIRRYGFGYGFLLGCDRLMRENDDPWVYRVIRTPHEVNMKWDPVP